MVSDDELDDGIEVSNFSDSSLKNCHQIGFLSRLVRNFSRGSHTNPQLIE